MKLSELDPKNVVPVISAEQQGIKPAGPPEGASASLKLSDLKPEDVQPVDRDPGLLSRAWNNPFNPAKYALGALKYGGEQYDKYVTGPTRKAIEYPVTRQWPEQAPSGAHVLETYGVDRKPFEPQTQGILAHAAESIPGPLGWLATSNQPKVEKYLKETPKTEVMGPGVEIAADPFIAASSAWDVGKLGVRGAAGLADRAVLPGLAKMADVTTGTKAASGALDTGRDIIKGIGKQIENLTSPRQSIDWTKHVETAGRNGINVNNIPATAEFGKESFPGRLQRSVREGPAGEDLMDKYQSGMDQVNSAINKHVSGIGGGTIPDHVDAGNEIVDAWKKGESKLHDGLDITYSKVQKYAPGLMMNRDASAGYQAALNGAENQAKSLIARGIGPQRDSGAALLDVTNTLRKSKTFKQNVDALRGLGDIAFDSRKYSEIGKAPPDMTKMQDLYFKLRDGLIGTVEKDINPEFASELKDNNKTLSEFLTDKKGVNPVISSNKLAPEQIYQRLIKNGNTKQIQALKDNIDPSSFNRLKSAFLNDLVARNADNNVLYGKTIQNLKKAKDQIKVMFDPSETQNLTDLLKLGNDFGPAVMSNSGTGASNAFRELFHHPIEAGLSKRVLDATVFRGRKGTQSLNLERKGLIKPEIGPFGNQKNFELRASQSQKAQALTGKGKDDQKK